MNAQLSAIATEPSDRELGDLLPGLPPAFVQELAATKRLVVYESGEAVFRAGARGDPGLVLDGLLRQSVRSESGRQATLRYVRRGGLVGTVFLFGPMPFTVTAVERSTVVHFEIDVVRRMADEHQEFALVVARILNTLANDVADSAAKFAFMSVEQRVVDHLLALGSPMDGSGDAVVALVTQQQLADAVGTAREVVARVLRGLRTEGLIDESRGAIVIPDRAGLLHRSATPRQRLSDDLPT